MAIDLINFQRPFQSWAYSVSHAQLLIRSGRSDDYATRIDILFKAVIAIKLPTVCHGVRVMEAPPDEAAKMSAESGARYLGSQGAKSPPSGKLFLTSGVGFSGYVIAGVMFWHEDEGHHYDESYFQSSFMTRV